MAESQTQVGLLKKMSVVLTNFDGSKKIDISSMVIAISITEDIFKNTLYGSVEIKDAVNMIGGMPNSPGENGFLVCGQEFIEIDYQVDLRGDPISLRFAVYAISNIDSKPNNTLKEYTLSFASEEHLIDASTVVMKAYSQAHSDNVTSLLNDYLFINKPGTPFKGKRVKNLNKLQTTKGLQKVVIPRLSPLQAAQFLARRSIADQTFNSATYLFFENFKGFNFCDIEFLITAGLNKLGGGKTSSDAGFSVGSDFQYYFESPHAVDPSKNTALREVQTVMAMSHKSYFDTVEKLKRGMFESDVIVYDFINQKTIPTRWRFANNAANSVTLGNLSGHSFNENTPDFIKILTDTDDKDQRYNRMFLIPKDLSQTSQDNYLDLIYPSRASYFTRLAQNMYTLSVYGNPMINAGDVISLNVPAGEGNTQKVSPNDEILTGYYLVCTINHQLTQTTYTAKMDVYKNAFGAQNQATDVAKNTPEKPVNNNSLIQQYKSDLSTPNRSLTDDGNPSSGQNTSGIASFLKKIIGI